MTDLSDEEALSHHVLAVAAEASLRLVFPDSVWTVTFPAGWQPVCSDEDDLWCWELEATAHARVRLRRRPQLQIEVDVVSLGADVAMLHPPSITTTSTGIQIPWFAGSTGEVLQVMPDASALWVQLRGACSPSGRGFAILPEPLVLRPGQGNSAAWRRHHVPAGSLPPEPAWVPRQRYFPMDEALDVVHSDAAVMGMGLNIATTAEGSCVHGSPGLHNLAFLDARGTALVEVGWFNSLTELVEACVALPGVDPNVRAWLLAAGPEGDSDPDVLDVALADALEIPTVWGVLAGMRIVTLTDLPVSAEVLHAAQCVWREDMDDHVRRLLVTYALLTGWQPVVVAEWLRNMGAAPDNGAQAVLASVGFGRITSSPLAHGGREVALARMWLAARGESAAAAEWERAVDSSRARLMCSLSTNPVAEDVAWLLVESLLD
ncbi:hypothetical protein [Tessaracoccus sp.]